MVLSKMNKNNKVKKLSDYIMTFAFMYSSIICFIEAGEKWQDNRILAVIILICGFFSFIAVFRSQIAGILIKLKKRNKNE